MDHACSRCGAVVPDATPFCRECRAPQINVYLPEAAAPVTSAIPPAASLLVHARQFARRDAFLSALLGGLLSALLMVFPFSLFGLGMVAGGALAVTLYRRKQPQANPSLGAGALLGALSGFLGCSVFVVLTVAGAVLTDSGAKIKEKLFESLDQSAARSNEPQMQEVLQYLKSPEGFVVMVVVAVVFLLVLFLVFSSLGGAIGTTLGKKKRR
jgi:hypothetical protein